MGATGDELTSLRFRVVDRVTDRAVVAVTVLVEHVSVSVRKGTALTVLTGNAHVVALVYKRSEGECLTSTPIDTLLLLDRLLTSLEDLDDLRVEITIFGQLGDPPADLP